jgi:hypothetical protein
MASVLNPEGLQPQHEPQQDAPQPPQPEMQPQQQQVPAYNTMVPPALIPANASDEDKMRYVFEQLAFNSNLMLQNQTRPPPSNHRVKPKEPEAFDGEKDKYRGWKQDMMTYLLEVTGDERRISIIFSYIHGPSVDNWKEVYFREHFDENYNSWTIIEPELWTHLDDIFVDHNEM